MRRHILTTAAALLLAAIAYAQPAQGSFSLVPRVGVALANIANEEITFDKPQKGKYREGFVGGIDLQYQATDLLGVSFGVAYSRQGCKYNDTDLSGAAVGSYTAWSDCRTSIDYLNVPVLAHIYVAEGFALNAGLQAGFPVHENLHYVSTDVTVNKDGSYTYDPSENIDTKDIGTCSPDISIPVGLSYEYANVVLDLRYNIGLTKVFKTTDKSRNSVFALTVGYRVGL